MFSSDALSAAAPGTSAKQRGPQPGAGPIKNPARNGIALRREISGCRQARPGLTGWKKITVIFFFRIVWLGRTTRGDSGAARDASARTDSSSTRFYSGATRVVSGGTRIDSSADRVDYTATKDDSVDTTDLCPPTLREALSGFFAPKARGPRVSAPTP